MNQNKKDVKEHVRCEDLFREVAPGFDPGEIYSKLCNKLRQVATGSELSRLKLTAVDMLRRCRDGDETACRLFRKLQNAPAWRIESLVWEYMQYLKYLDCMRNYDDEKTCRRYLPPRSESQIKERNVEEKLQKLPVEYVVEEGEVVVKVGKGEKLPEPQFKATINELKKMGFEFDSDTKLWRGRI